MCLLPAVPCCFLPCTLHPLEPGHRAAEPAPRQGLLRLKKGGAPSTCTAAKTARRSEHHQNTDCISGFNSWFLLSVTSCPVLESIVHEFSHRYEQQGYSSHPYLYKVQLFESNDLPALSPFFPGRWKGAKAQRKTTHVKQREKAKDVELYRNQRPTSWCISHQKYRVIKLILTAFESLSCQDFPGKGQPAFSGPAFRDVNQFTLKFSEETNI